MSLLLTSPPIASSLSKYLLKHISISFSTKNIYMTPFFPNKNLHAIIELVEADFVIVVILVEKVTNAALILGSQDIHAKLCGEVIVLGDVDA